MDTLRRKVLISICISIACVCAAGCWDSNKIPGSNGDLSSSDNPDTSTHFGTGVGSDPDTMGFGEACDWATDSVICDRGIYKGNLSVTSRADLENLAGYTDVDGMLHIGCKDCLNLCPLVCLETIGDQLVIGEMKSLGGGRNLLLKNLDGIN